MRASDSERHRSLHEVVTDASAGAGGDETARAVLHQASPAFAAIGFVGNPVFLRDAGPKLIDFDSREMQILTRRWRSKPRRVRSLAAAMGQAFHPCGP